MILLDSNVLLWVVSNPKRLGQRALRLIQAEKTVYYSATSLFEIALKHSDRKLSLVANLGELLSQHGFTELRLTSDTAFEISRFTSYPTRDPLDLMILCQASYHNLKLLTSDRAMLALGQTWILDAQE